MRLDKTIHAVEFAAEIEKLIEAVREQTLQELPDAPAGMTSDDRAFIFGETDKPAAPEPDPPAADAHAFARPPAPVPPPSAASTPPSPPDGTRRRGGIPKLTEMQKADICQRYRLVMRNRERAPRGWSKQQAELYGVSVGTIYNVVSGVMVDMLTDDIAPRSRTREIAGTYGEQA